ncbi:hypothetical protein BsWGS_14102 [Bradybaena similaris]
MRGLLTVCVVICCTTRLAFALQNRFQARQSCLSLAQVSKALWDNDVHRMSSGDIILNYQNQVSSSDKTDKAGQKLFASVNENKLAGPTYKTLLALLDNYVPDKGVKESLTTTESNENTAFLNAILNTSVMNVLLNYLQCRGFVTNQDGLRSVLTKIWFDFYPRSGSSTVTDTSGFEHIIAGEYKSSTEVNGFHNWVSFYHKEKAGHVNYYGYVSKAEPRLIGAMFNWNNRIKSLGSLFIGVSPEFDIAIYTLCYFTNPNKRCPVVLDGRTINIQTYDTAGHISTAYPEVPSSKRKSYRARPVHRAP